MSPSPRAPGKPLKVLVRRHGSGPLSPALRRAVQALAQKKGVRLDLESAKEVSADKDVENASEWNSLLINARADRGPQWDVATQMFHVDKESTLFYDPTALFQSDDDTPGSEANQPSDITGGGAGGTAVLHPQNPQPHIPPYGGQPMNLSHQPGVGPGGGFYDVPPPLSNPHQHQQRLGAPGYGNMGGMGGAGNPYPQQQRQSQYNVAPGQFFNGTVNLAPQPGGGQVMGMGMGGGMYGNGDSLMM